MNLAVKICLILTIFTWHSLAERNLCCPDNKPLVNYRCTNETQSWAKCCRKGAYILPSKKFKLSTNDRLSLSNDTTFIEQNRYCLGHLEESEDAIAVVCFPIIATNYKTLILTVCCIVSIVLLALTIGVYVFIPNLRDLQGKCIMITIFNLMVAFIDLTFLQTGNSYSNLVCLTIASSLLFWFLSAFCWMNIVAFNIWRTTVYPGLLSKNKHLFLYYNIYGWSVPTFFLIVAHISHHAPGNHMKPKWTHESCWFSDLKSGLAYFYGPMLIIIIFNLVMFISLGWSLWNQGIRLTNNRNNNKFRSRKYKCLLYLKIFLIMGICWIFEALSFIIDISTKTIHTFWVVTDLINALQGVTIFLLLVVFRRRVHRSLAQRGVFRRFLPQQWATMHNEECEEDEDEIVAEIEVQEASHPL